MQVLTTDEGPAVCNVFLGLQNNLKHTGVALPQYQPETKEVFEMVQQWPGFDNETFVKNMGSSDNNWFVLWKKQ